MERLGYHEVSFTSVGSAHEQVPTRSVACPTSSGLAPLTESANDPDMVSVARRYEDPPALLAVLQPARGLVPDAVKLHRRQREVATVATAPDQARHSHAAQPGAQALIGREELFRHSTG